MAEAEVLRNLSFERVERCMSVMQSGTQMVKLKNGSKGLVRLFYLDEHRSCIRWRPSRKSEKAKITIDSLYKVTEGRQSDVFHRHADGNLDPGCCFTIYHGNHMDSLDLVTSNAEEARTWVTGLRYLMAGISDEDSLAKRQRTHDQWMKQTFEEADKNGDGFLNIDEIYQLLHKMNVNLPRRKVKQMFQEADTDDQQGTLTFEEFSVFYKMMSLRRDLFLLLMCFSDKKDHLTAEELGNFLRVEQKMSNVTTEFCLDIIDKFEVSEENKQKGILGIEGFTNFMRSPACDVFNPQHNEVNQDMDQPLCSYFVASSHNTYLTGDQLLSHSKTDMYAWVLQAGCRCVEVDCWDGPDGEPMVQHGYTLTSKIPFKSVIETIDKYAFINNEYPVILSIENHCSVQQQKKIAQYLKELFKDKLDLGDILNKDSTQLPSPNSLKGKILIKGKRLPPYLSADAEEGEVSDDDSADEIEDDFKLKNNTSNGPTQHMVESQMRKKLDSLLKESQIVDKEDTDSFSIRALLRATHEGLHKNLTKNSKEGLKKSQSRSFISNLKQKRHSKSRLKCQSVDTDDDGQDTGGQFNRGGRRRKTIKLSRDLSDLVVFTNSVVSQECLDEGPVVNVLSFSETRAHQLVHHRAERFLSFNQRQLSRIYPSAYRIDSSNFNPQTYWNVGCQLVALNYQTEGRMMQLNRAKFMVNGGSGYVLKPPPMCNGTFNPYSDDPLPAYPKKQLVLKIISGQQLPKPPDSMLGDRGEIIDPFVEVEIIGLPVDCCKEQTRVVDDNGFNPVWEETLSFTLHMPETALVRFLVWDHDPIGRDFVGQRTVAFTSLMPGYRHVYLEGMMEASIFVHISVHDIYGKWSPLVLNPSFTILHFLGASKGRQLRGFRGLFSRGSKCSVDTQIGVLPRKRSLSNHLLRRTASAPAKGRKKTKTVLSETSLDKEESSNGDIKKPALEKRVGPRMGTRMGLQHRPVSMPLERLLQGRLTVSSSEQDGPDTGTSTIIDLFPEKPRSASVDHLIETSSEIPDDNTDYTQQIQPITTDYIETAETSYFMIEGCGETSTDVLAEPLSRSLTLQTKASSQGPTKGHLRLLDQRDCHDSLQTEFHQRQDLKSNQITKAALHSVSFVSPPLPPPLPSTLHQSDQQDQKSLYDSALSHLIDAVSLGNEYDTCGSISALIGQYEDSAEQSTLNQSSASQPPQVSVQPLNNKLFSTPQKKNIQDSLQKSQQPDEKHIACSPETSESTVFTILDEQVLSLVSAYDIPDQTICKNLENLECMSADGSRGPTISMIPFRKTVEENSGWDSHRDKSYKAQFQPPTFSRNWDYGSYKDTSINSTASERFLICHDSASSSLLEVEVSVDGDPLDTTLVPSHPESGQNTLYLPPSISKKAYKPTESSRFHSSSPHKPFICSGHLHDYSINQPQTEQFNTSNVAISGHFQPGIVNGVTHNIRHVGTKDKNGIICKTQHFQNGFSSSDCLLRTQDINSQQQNNCYMPGSVSNMIYSSVEYRDTVVPTKQYSKSLQQNQALKQTNSEIYKGIYLVGSPVPTAPSPCKSKSLGDLTSEDISCNFQSKYKVISRSFITPVMQDHKRKCGRAKQPPVSDPLTEQLRKLVTLDEVDPQSTLSQLRSIPKSFSALPSVPLNSVVSTEDSNDPPPFLSRKLSSRSQSRVRHIASRAREKQQEALKVRPAGGTPDVVLRNKAVSSQNPPINRHSTGSYIAGYLEQVGLKDRGLPEGSCRTFCYGAHDRCYADDSVIPHNSHSSSEPEVYFLLRL
ncbi:1-phosphatidylinositol 4,5-bisphosphate phosphodiesterase eta-1 isoform X3 [Silurus meridionalis]|uniref:1-phosphatidylinositol 4,5-bisphosphate phosphodiesterase eta-1 isoform X3 n=1 Tax=Silurus meridionalis TaxID=175797 RepID=UPI001EEB3913|nr:1-phosphatidylinositol 4,5-bisphosphate phosphodiesterase eta-1 isoform X3 [Silurus meridionalis]